MSHFLFLPLKYHFFVKALVKYTYFVFRAVMITHFVCLTIYFITPMHPCQSTYHTFCFAAVYVSHSVTSSIFFPLGNHNDRIWQFCVFSPVSTHLGCITLAPVVHFKISPLCIHLIPCTLSIQWWHCGGSGSAAAAACQLGGSASVGSMAAEVAAARTKQ
jgi:hypothetical protein